MDFVFMIWSLVGAAVSLVGCVFALWFARRSNVRELRGDVDDLISVVDKVARSTRREVMKRVRGGGEAMDAPPGFDPTKVSPTPQDPLHARLAAKIARRGGMQ